MSSDAVITMTGIGKCFAVFGRPIDRLKQLLSRGRRRYYSEFWALQDIDLEIRRGETVGIIGSNGAGKSTLLQIIAGTLAPTTGTLAVDGRVAALLELGTGFNPEFTGRENLRMGAAIHGIPSARAADFVAEATAFSELEEFIDWPVKSYSSGMQARLGFAAAVHSDPQVFIVDESLAVGDEAFQRKCFAHLDRLRSAGTTILFVSHSMTTTTQLCDRAILLDHGRRLLTGPTKLVTGSYQRLLYAPAAERSRIREELVALDGELGRSGATAPAGGTIMATPAEAARDHPRAAWDPTLLPAETLSYQMHGCEIFDVRIETPSGQRVNVLVQGETYDYRFQAHFHHGGRAVRIGMMIRTVTGVEVGGLAFPGLEMEIDDVPAGSVLDARFPFRAALTAQTFFGSAGVQGEVGGERTYLHRLMDACMFRIIDTGRQATGIVDLSAERRPAVTRLTG